jgi:hypothetical protein
MTDFTEILKQIEFIKGRTDWLKSRPRNAEGVLERADDRLEAGTLIQLTDEFTQAILNGAEK